MTGQDPESAELLIARKKSELSALDVELGEALGEMTQSWGIGIGRFQFRRRITSQRITWIYITFAVVCVAAGTSLIAVNRLSDLGIALVAGGIFAFGTFVTQYWALAVQAERQGKEWAFGERQRGYLTFLADARTQLYREIHELERLTGNHGDPNDRS